MKDDKYKEIPKMFSDEAVEFPKELKVMMMDKGMSEDGYQRGGTSKNVMYNVKGNKKKDY